MRSSLPALLVLALGPNAPAAGANSPGEAVEASVRELLAAASPEEHQRLREALVDLGPAAVPALFRSYAGLGPEPTTGVDSAPLALEALVAFPAEEVVPALAALGERTPLNVRLAAARVLGELATAEAVPPLLDVLATVDELRLRSRHVHGTLERALAACLAGDPASWDALAEESTPGEGIRGTVVLDAVAKADRPQAVALFAAWTSAPSRAHPLLVRRFGEVLGRFPWAGESDGKSLRSLLQSGDPALRREAALACGRTQDLHAAPVLILLLGDPDPAVADAATWALCTLGAVDGFSSADDWTSWLRRERLFWKDTGRALVAGLPARDEHGFVQDLRTLTAHPLHRVPIARALAEALGSAAPEDRAPLCRALGLVGSPVAVPALVEALDTPHPPLRRAAFEALRTLTGRSLPPDASAWRPLVHGS